MGSPVRVPVIPTILYPGFLALAGRVRFYPLAWMDIIKN